MRIKCAIFLWWLQIVLLFSSAAGEVLKNRAYPGAPPSIPHKVNTAAGENSANCLTCHLLGDYAPPMGKKAPKTPHPAFSNCRQCHAARETDTLFKPSNWQIPELSKAEKPELAPAPLPVATIGREPTRVPLPFEAGKHPAFVASRTENLRKYPCQECHQGGKLKGNTHSEIAKQHPGKDFSCQTCHNQKTGGLKKLSGEPLSFDHSYQLCAQCHSTQARDWQGGAHGKRVTGWHDQRVLQTCTACHNPHAPGFPKRQPTSIGGKSGQHAQHH